MRRKHAIVWLLIAALMAAMLVGCGAKENTQEPSAAPAEGQMNETGAQNEQPSTAKTEQVDYPALYAPVLDETCDVLYNGRREEMSYAYLPSGVMELAAWTESDELLRTVGYSIRDLSGDGVPELLIGVIANELAPTPEKSVIFGGYTLMGGKPAKFLDGWARNSYQWLGDGRFYNFGSGGAAYSGFGAFRLSPDGMTLNCEEFYFTSEKDETSHEIGFYHNTTGSWDAAASEELALNEDAFWQIMLDYENQCLTPELTPFSNYAAIYIARSAGSKVYASYFDDVADRLPPYEDASTYLPDGTYDTTVVFQTGEEAQNFKLLALALRGVDENGNAAFDIDEVFSLPALYPGVPLVVPMSFPGDMPSSGFSYTDADGTVKTFTLSVSGRDGTLVIAPIF